MPGVNQPIEYGTAYWIAVTTPGATIYLGALETSPPAVKVTRPESQRRLEFENELGRDGWLISSEWIWVTLDNYSADPHDWLKARIRQEFPEFASAANRSLNVSSCSVRRNART